MNEISELQRLLDEWNLRNRPHRTFDKSVLAWGWKERTCSRCSRTFYAPGGVRFCTERCQLDDRNEMRRKRRAERERDLITCANPDCGNTFQPIRSTARYCKDACRQAAHRKRQANKREGG